MRDFDKLWDYNHPVETEYKFRDLLTQEEASTDQGYRAELLTQIARTQGLQRKFTEAHETLNQVETMLNDDLKTAQIRYLLERGRVYNSSSQQSDARPLFAKAWEIGIVCGEDEYAVDAAHMLGIAESTPELRMEWNLKALAYAEEHPNAKRWLGSLYNNIGWAQVEAGKLAEALDLFERALRFRLEQGNAGTIFIARWCVAKVLRLMNETQQALEIQMELLMESEQSHTPDGYVNEELGECLLSLDRRKEAQSYFVQAYKMLSLDQWLVEHEPERLARLKELGN